MEEGKRSRVKMESILSVVSGQPSEPGITHNLSPLDQAMGGHTIHLVFYYKSNPFVDGLMPSDLGNLRVTLSELLDEYPLVTGRLSRVPEGDLQVKFNDAGVRMLQAGVDATLDEWLRSGSEADERDLTMWEEMPHDPSFWSPFRVQISNFKCGGIALGLSCTHILADIPSATMLIKSCTAVHRRQPPTHPPVFNLPSTKLPPSNSLPSFPTTPTKMATATFIFSAAAVDKCLALAQPHCPGATPFDVLAALFWSLAGERSLSICVDCRSHLSVPHAFFGNALRFSTLTDDLLSGGVGKVSGHVHQHVESLKGDAFSPAVNVGNQEPSRIYGDRLTCINMEHLSEAYDAEFKEGERPVHVSCNVGNVEGGVIMVMQSAEGGRGRTVTATLPEEQLANLCKDEAILDMEPTMILCGRK